MGNGGERQSLRPPVAAAGSSKACVLPLAAAGSGKACVPPPSPWQQKTAGSGQELLSATVNAAIAAAWLGWEGGLHHKSLLQKWQLLWRFSQIEQRGVICPAAHSSAGALSIARQKSQNRPVLTPQSMHGLQSIESSPQARQCMGIFPLASLPPNFARVPSL